ncbi:hypothetical protein DPMN_068759 [Dreissena polymorpha]|uniref:Uncharacterized protein n=1 Tax=Dreissena polymorpha TaxID=45954 RepID=A0A9D3YZS6_DREPO|nr:hypothetical protein DPMN_068759 [Dreissena polymorpha]
MGESALKSHEKEETHKENMTLRSNVFACNNFKKSESEKEEEDGRGRRKKQVTSKFLDFVMDPDEVSNGHGPQSPRKQGGANRDSFSRSSSENSRSRSPLEPQSVSEESC